MSKVSCQIAAGAREVLSYTNEKEMGEFWVVLHCLECDDHPNGPGIVIQAITFSGRPTSGFPRPMQCARRDMTGLRPALSAGQIVSVHLENQSDEVRTVSLDIEPRTDAYANHPK